MTTEGEGPTRANGQKLDDVVRDAGECYDYLKGKEVSGTRLDVAVVGLVVWFAAFAAIGLSAFAIFGREISYVAVSFLTGIAIGVGAALLTYVTRRSRRSKFAELGALLTKMKEGPSSEDGLT